MLIKRDGSIAVATNYGLIFITLGKRVREASGLYNTRGNRRKLRKMLNLVAAEIGNGVFEFAHRFSHNRKKAHFTDLEGRATTIDPEKVLFGSYPKTWFDEIKHGMSESKIISSI
jgi:hypothetical protein